MRDKGKRYSEEFKRQIVKEAEETGNATSVARRHNLVPDIVTCGVGNQKRKWINSELQYCEIRRKVWTQNRR